MNISEKYQVFVAEDEPYMLNNIIKKVENINPAFHVIGCADNGKDALDQLEQLHPDLLITDICMPIMDGLELIEQLRKKEMDFPIILLSGYSEFEYAKRALQFNVTDYLLKPLKTQDLEKTLKQIQMILKSKQDKIIMQNIHKQIHNCPGHSEIPSTLSNNKFIMLLLSYGNLCNQITSSVLSTRCEQFWNVINWNTILASLIEDNVTWWIVDEKIPSQKILLFSYQDFPEHLISKITYTIFDQLKKQSGDISINICVSSNPFPYTEIHSEAQKLRSLMEKYLVIGRSSIITDQDKDVLTTLPPPLSNEIINNLKKVISLNSFSALYSTLEELFQNWEHHNYPQQMLENAVSHLCEIIFGTSKLMSEVEIYHTVYEIQQMFPTIQNINEISKKIITLLNSLNTPELSRNDSLSIQIEQYIQSHIDSPIVIEDIAKEFNYSPSYIVRIFKKHYGKTPVQYLIDLRIENAKYFLQNCPQLDIQTISMMVGYQNPSYFHRIFKKTVGIGPLQYRETFNLQN